MRIGIQSWIYVALVAAVTHVAASPTTMIDQMHVEAKATAPSATEAEAAVALLASMPDCGRSCLMGAIAASPCETTDIACSCSNATLTAEVEICVKQTCTTKQSLSSKNATSILCSAPVRDDTKAVSYAGVIGGILALIAYIMRMVSRLPRFGGSLGWDDAVITIAMLEIIPLTVFSVILANLGLGKDIWTVPFENITAILKVYYFDEDLYLTALPLVKISILLFYNRIFVQQWFRIASFITMAACAMYGIAFLLVSVFQCRPLSYAWHNWDHEHTGTCNDINAQGWTSAALNVILDVIVLLLPMPVIAKLQLNRRKKALILLMFSLGFLVTIISILRLQVLVHFGGSSNFTWDYRAVGYWSTSETDLAVICACMPGMRGLIKWAWPRMMGESTRAKSPGPASSYGRYGQSGPPSYEQRSQPANDLYSKGEKDEIPLVEVIGPSDKRDSRPDPSEWPLPVDDARAWDEPKAPRRMSLRKQSVSGGGARWKMSLDS